LTRFVTVRRAAARLVAGVAGLALGAGAAVPLQAGTVTGTITLLEKGGRVAPDSSDVVVWLEGPKGRVTPSRASMVMKGKEFRPHLVAVAVGSTVEFPNDDPIFHNAFSVSGDNRFDLDLYKRPKTGAWTFQRPGVVRVYCNIHPQMSAVVVVRDNPWFVKARSNGAFTLDSVPAGRHVLKAWHERGGEAVAEVSVPAEGHVSANLTLDGSRFKRSPHKNKFGKDYAAGEPY
jgi:plastocyanin